MGRPHNLEVSGGTELSHVTRLHVEKAVDSLVDLTEAYSKPLSPEVLDAADIAVTMGRSVGAVDIPDGARHLD